MRNGSEIAKIEDRLNNGDDHKSYVKRLDIQKKHRILNITDTAENVKN